MRTLLLCLLLSLPLAAASCDDHDVVARLQKQFVIANDACRGGSGDDPKTMDACASREDYLEHLEQRNVCYDKTADTEAEMWVKCAE